MTLMEMDLRELQIFYYYYLASVTFVSDYLKINHRVKVQEYIYL